MKLQTKKLVKKIMIGALIIIPIAFILGYLFAELKMNNNLAVFLIVLVCSVVCFTYILIYNKVEQRKIKRRELFDDPFSK